MAEIIFAVAAKVSEYLVAPIGRQFGYLFCYQRHIEELRNIFQKLREMRDDVQISVEEGRRRGDEIRPYVQEWLNRVDQITGEAEEISMKDENKRRLNGWCPNLSPKSRYQLGREAYKKAQQVIAEIQEAYDFPDGLPYYVPPRRVTYKEDEFFESRAFIVSKIMHALRDDKTRMIGVWGMGGVGKTTLLKQVAERAKQQKLFTTHVYVDLSCTREGEITPSAMLKIQQHIAKKLDLKFEEETTPARAAELMGELKKKKILIVLDDIWKEVHLDEVGIPSEDYDNKVCKILLASRDENLLLREMGAQECFQIRHLREEEAWRLFKKTAGDSVESNIKLRSIANEVVKECGGLPISIVTTAKALQDKGLIVWKNALEALRSSAPTITNTEGVGEKVYSCLELCYEHLKGDEVKSLFLLCGLLGDGDISMDDLFKYGICLDLFDYMDSLEEVRDKVISLVNILKASNLLLDVVEDGQIYCKPSSLYFVEEEGNGFVRMHELVRDIARLIASKDPHRFMVTEDVRLQELEKRDIELRNCTGMSLKCRLVQEPPEGLICPKLVFFSLDSNDGFLYLSNTYFKDMKEVIVLSLSSVNLKRLPSSLCFLSNLRTLCLFRCGRLKNMAMLGELKKLQILSILGCQILEFPVEMMELCDLRMLSLRPCPVFIPGFVISRLFRLEHLCMRKKFSSWESEEEDEEVFYHKWGNDWFSELKHLTCLRALDVDVDIPYSYVFLEDVACFENLTRYDICMGCPRDSLDDRICTSRRLKLKEVEGRNLVKHFSKLFRTIEVLDLSRLEKTRHFVNELGCDGFLHLKHLSVRWSDSVKCIMNTMEMGRVRVLDHYPPPSVFPLLEELNLKQLYGLEIVCLGPIPMGCFANLRILRIESCPRLKSILWLPTPTPKPKEPILVFPQLRLLKLNSLPNFIDLCSTGFSGNQDSLIITFFNQWVSFPSLEDLDISNLNAVEKLWHDELIADSFGKLKTLSVVSCKKMLRLIPSNMLKKLSSLQSLRIVDCNSVEEVFDMEAIDINESHDISALQLRELCLEGLKNLKHIWNGSPQGLIIYQNLKSVRVSHCPSLEIPFPGYVVRRLLQVKELDMNSHAVEEIVAYEDVAKVATMFLFPEVISFESSCLNELKCFYLELDTLEWPMLKTLEVESCENPEILVSKVDKTVDETVEQPIFLCDKDSIFPSLEVSFPSLEYLKLSLSLKKNQEIQELQVSFRALSSLKILIVENCPFILKAFSSNLIGSLNNLKKLTVKKCDLLEEVFDLKGHDHVDVEQVEMLSALEELNLIDLPKLRYICNNCPPQVLCFQKLKFLWVKNCDLLEEVFDFKGHNHGDVEQVEMLSALEELNLIDLPKLRYICNNCPPQVLCFQKLKLLQVKKCGLLEEVFDLKGHGDVENFEMLSELEELNVIDLPKLRYICNNCPPQVLCFQKLKLLQVKKCGLLEEVIDLKGHKHGDFEQVEMFSELTELNLIDLPKLRYICNNCPPQVLCFQKLKLLQVKQCDNLVHLFSSSTASRLVQLQRLCVEHCSAMKNIIVEDGDVDNRPPQVSSLQNLKFVQVKNCDSLMYLFPSSFALTLLRLQELCLEHCDMMEEIVIGGEGVTKEIDFPQITHVSLIKLPKLTSFYLGQTPEMLGMGETNTALGVLFNEKVSFPSLEDLNISNLDTVEKIWHDEFIADSFGKLKRLSVVSCQKMLRLISSNMLNKLSSLQSLTIVDCNLVEEVFDMETMESKESHDIPAFQLRELCLGSLKKLKYIWNKAPQGLLSYPNLKSVRVSRCPSLKIPFPGYVVRSLLQVKEPEMNSCAMKDIVTHEDVAKVAKMVTMFLFPEVTSLESSCLNELKCFYLGLDTLEWAMMKKLEMESCESLEILASKLDKTVEQPIFLCSKAAFPSLEIMNLSLKVEEIQHLHLLFGALFKLKTLIVENCPFLLNLLSLDFIKILKGLENLTVKKCDLLQGVFDLNGLDHGEGEHVELLSKLKQLNLIELPELKSICNNNSPHVLCFRNMKSVEVKQCYRLAHLFSASIAMGFEQLQELCIEHCDMMEEIITSDEGVTEEISFPQITRVALLKLPKLTSFYLNHTPEQIRTRESNTAHGVFFNEKVSFPSLEDLNISNLDTVEKIWHDEFIADSFRKLKRLSVISCQKMLRLIPSNMLNKLSSLQSLKIVDCNLVEEVFDMETMERKESHDIPAFKLRDLCLGSLKNLKYIWNKAPQGLLSYPNLKSVQVSHCPSFKIPFPGYVVRSLLQFKELDMNSRSVEEIVAYEDVAKVATMFLFPEVTSLESSRLNELKHLYFGLDTLEWAILKTLEIESCESLEILASKLDKTVEQPIFLCDKVSFPSLEDLNISNLDTVEKIWHDDLIADSFGKLKRLSVVSCQKMLRLIPSNMLKKLLSLQSLKIMDCNLVEEVFDLEAMERKESHDIPAFKLRELCLESLKNLRYIWNKAPQGLLTYPNLKSVQVSHCPSLKIPFPGYVVRSLLQIKEPDMNFHAVKGIVAYEDVAKVVTMFLFPEVTSLESSRLNELKHFYFGLDTLEWSTLKTLEIESCESLETLASKLDKTAKQPIFLCNKAAFPSLEFLNLSVKVEEIQHLHLLFGVLFNLKTLIVENCPFLLNLFSSDFIKGLISLQNLTVKNCDLLQGVFDLNGLDHGEGEHVELLSNLELLNLIELPELKSIVYNNPPHVLFFQNLKSMQVKQCHNLTHLFSSSMVLGLKELQDLSVEHCDIMEEIVIARGGVTEEITFPQITRVTLLELPKLASFYPRNQTLVRVLMGDSSTSVGVLFNEEVAFPLLETLYASGLHNVKKIWHNKLLANSFSKLKEAKVENCKELDSISSSNVMSELSSLEFLRIARCDKLQEVFYLDETNVQEIVRDNQLNRLVLDDLPKLEHICHKVLRKQLCLQNLKFLEVHNCVSMKNLFSSYTELEGNKETIRQEGGAEEVLELPELTSVSLKLLPRLASFYPGSYTPRRVPPGDIDILTTVLFNEKVAFPSLESLEISGLGNMKNIWYNKLMANSFGKLEKVEVENCNELQNVLQSEVLKWLPRLHFLRTTSCGQLKVVFDLEGADDILEDVTATELNHLVLQDLPQLQYIWNKDPYGILTFQKLDFVEVFGCHGLKSHFPVGSLVRDLSQLEKQLIRSHGTEDFGEKDEGEGFIFPQVTYDKLLDLQKIKGKEVVKVDDDVCENSEDMPGSSG